MGCSCSQDEVQQDLKVEPKKIKLQDVSDFDLAASLYLRSIDNNNGEETKRQLEEYQRRKKIKANTVIPEHYEGEKLNGKRHGKGIMFFKNGNRYEGQWQHDKMHGEGIMYYKAGWKIKGNQIYSNFYGQCIIYHTNGTRYEGTLLKNRENGPGKLYDKNNKLIYEGQFMDGMKNGIGKLYVNGKLKYEGYFVDNEFDGKGKKYYDSSVYEGDFVKGKITGMGEATFSDRINRGVWKNEEMVSGVLIDRKTKKLVYEGSCSNNSFHGWGTEYEENGDKFEGIFEKGYKKYGKLYSKEGDEYEYNYDENQEPYGIVFCNCKNGDTFIGFMEGYGLRVLNSGEKILEYREKGELKNSKPYEKEDEEIGNNLVNEYKINLESKRKKRIYMGDKNTNGYAYYINLNNSHQNYEGNLVNGEKDGYGVLTGNIGFNDGKIYEGNFKNDKYNGFGTLYLGFFEKYEGEFLDGKKNGKGTYFYEKGSRYIGDFKNDKYNGQGVFYFDNGERFVGEVIEGKDIETSGNYYYKNGENYFGKMKNFKKNGKGTLYKVDGSILEGNFEDDKLVGKYKLKGNNFTILEEDLPRGKNPFNGKVKITFTDDNIYSYAQYEDGKKISKEDFYDKDGKFLFSK